jgi:hypothetical protein
LYLVVFRGTGLVFRVHRGRMYSTPGLHLQCTGLVFTMRNLHFCHILTAFNCVLIVFNCMSLYFNCIDLYLQCTGTAFTGHGACIYNAQGLHLEPRGGSARARALTCTGVLFRVHRGLIYVHRGCI